MSHASFQIVYDGPALENSTMDVRDLSPALIALGSVIDEANQTLNHGATKVSLNVRASFKTGCFGIEFDVAQGLLDQAVALFKDSGIASAKEIVEYLGFLGGAAAGGVVGLIRFIRWLKGRGIDEVILLENERVRVIVAKDCYETELAVIELYRNYQLRIALEKAIADPLEKEGIESVAFSVEPQEGFEPIKKSECGYFKAPTEEDELITDSVDDVTLQLVSVSFQEDNKWRFSDGGSTFYAAITHEDFLTRVRESQESFRAGDIMKVKLARKQWLSKGNMKSEAEVIEVLDHRAGGTQLKIPFRQAD